MCYVVKSSFPVMKNIVSVYLLQSGYQKVPKSMFNCWIIITLSAMHFSA